MNCVCCKSDSWRNELHDGLKCKVCDKIIKYKKTTIPKEKNELILYWAKQLEHKSLSVHELVENANWLIDKTKEL